MPAREVGLEGAHTEGWGPGPGEPVCKLDPGRAGGPIALLCGGNKGRMERGGSRPEGGWGSSGQPGPLQSPLKWPEGTLAGGAQDGEWRPARQRSSLTVLRLLRGPGPPQRAGRRREPGVRLGSSPLFCCLGA